jgi:diguanylate cyclase (GGDEF)-like protein/PAS domain S-box-containing protein
MCLDVAQACRMKPWPSIELMDLYVRIFEDTPDALIVVGSDGRIRMANARVFPMLGYRPEELVGKVVEMLVPDANASAHANHRERFMADPQIRRMGTARICLRARKKDGSDFPADIMLSPLNDGAVRSVLCAVRDFTERSHVENQLILRMAELEELHLKLTELASRDALTSLHNRRSFAEQLDWLLRNASRRHECLSILMIDLDRFKVINDTFGHAEGDRTLREVSAVIAATCRQNDVAARYGGEEFAVVLPDTDAAGCMVVAEHMRQSIERISGLRRSITASIGATTWCPGGEGVPTSMTADALLSAADQALYRAKAEGRNCLRHGGPLMQSRHNSV